MATRAERFRADANANANEERRGGARRKRRVARKKPKKAAWSRDKNHARVKATHALEENKPGRRPSRESTRGSANRAKADAPFNITEEKRKGAPEPRARKELVRRTKVRGAGTP
jgi:hypothetical protein